MADLFDISNLIGVETVAVKIKTEPGLPEKSSNEILTELFSNFDAVENALSPANSDKDSKENKTDKSKKKKKKHKHHKEKKHKKKSKHADNSSESSGEEGWKKKKKHKKKSKRKHEDRSSKSSDPEGSEPKKRKLNDEVPKQIIGDEFDILGRVDAIVDALSLNKSQENDRNESDQLDNNREFSSPILPSVLKNTEENEMDEPVPKLLEKPKSSVHGKIQIKDLKNSVVYNETVKEIENKEKEKKSRMEEGEISDSSDEERTPTLSPSPSNGVLKDSESPSSQSYQQVKDDLRTLLKKKEKCKSSNDHHSKSKSHKSKSRTDQKESKSGKDKHGKRSSSLQNRDRKKSPSPGYSRSHQNREKDRDRYREKSREKRERGRSHDRRDSRDRNRRYESDNRHRSRSDHRSKDRYGRGRSRSHERKERIEIDKKKLLEIARRNAINMIKQGTLPLAQQNKAIAAIQAGGKTVDELTDFCKSLSKSEALGELSSISSEDDSSSSEKGFHHPFLLKERPSSIILNIRDAKQLPTKTFQEKTAESSSQLRLQFPVSSGQYHRKTESEWIPVTPKKPEPTKKFVQATEPLHSVPTPAPVPAPAPPPPPASAPIFQQPAAAPNVDIGSIVSKRLAAMRKLSENPNDVQALNEMYQAQKGMRNWAESKQMPGQFVGTTGAKVLTPAELSSGYQAWARKDQLVSAQPVSGGMGMALLQKMGWRPGEGLGKNKEGTLVPLQLEVKLDKKGLVSDQDVGVKPGKGGQKPVIPTVKTLEGKHPVSLLGEYCSKRKWGAPVYELCFECGPDHRKNFVFKVKVDGIEYKPTVASPNKKQAKAEAAQICLQSLGLLPSS